MPYSFSGTTLARLRLLDKPIVHFILIALIGLIAYSNTFNVPFQWDDKFTFIAENPIVKDMSYFMEPSKAKGLEQYPALIGRYIGYLTFALNYKIHGFDVTGYHIFNLTVHILNALLVYCLVLLSFRTPFLKESSLREKSKYIALFTSLLFVSHPIQTEAVTYIFQRLASLAAFFYLLSLVLYVRWRLGDSATEQPPLSPPLSKGGIIGGGRTTAPLLYCASLLSAILAMKTKENAFTLPVVIIMFDFFFLRGPIKSRVFRLAPFFLTLLIIPLTLFSPAEEKITRTIPADNYYEIIPRTDYLFTQFRVIITYLRLLFFPANQNIAHDYPVYNSFFIPSVYLSFLFLSVILGLAGYFFYVSRFNKQHLRLIALGAFWFFITLSVESSIISLPMVINEYRIYLPSVGVFFAITATVFFLLERYNSAKLQAFIVLSFILLTLILSYATYLRNTDWQSEISLWEDTVRKSPKKPVPHNNLGIAYDEQEKIGEAIRQFQLAVMLRPDFIGAHNNLARAYYKKGSIHKAIEHYQYILKINPDYAHTYTNLGTIYYLEGSVDQSIKYFENALRLAPNDTHVHNNIGVAYRSKGLIDKAISHFEIALKLKPDFAEAHNNLGVAYEYTGLLDKAIEHYTFAVKLNRNYIDAYINLAKAYSSKGLINKAISYYEIVLELQPENKEAHYNLAVLYQERGL